MDFLRHTLICAIAAALFLGCASTPRATGPAPAKAEAEPWVGLHMVVPPRSELPRLKRVIAEQLAPAGVNVLLLEVDYVYAWQSHPELIEGGAEVINKEDARELASLCRANGIHLIPLFNCLGHQSWGPGSRPLLRQYPEFDETPEIPQDGKGVYCRSWCPLHPDVNKVAFALIDELIDAFQPDALHVGMDEVFFIANPKCPRCAGENPAELFAKAVNDLHKHVVDKKGLTMLMWGDRLLDMPTMNYNMFESSKNGTAPAVDLVPKDIIICDWHYGTRPDYPSIPFFQQKGFRVWPSSWNRADAALALLRYSRKMNTGNVIGHLCTSWCSPVELSKALLGETPQDQLDKTVAGVTEAFRSCTAEMKELTR